MSIRVENTIEEWEKPIKRQDNLERIPDVLSKLEAPQELLIGVCYVARDSDYKE